MFFLLNLLLFLDKMLKVTPINRHTELSPVPGVPGHAAHLLWVKVVGKVLHTVLEVCDGLRLNPDDMRHGLGPEAEIKW